MWCCFHRVRDGVRGITQVPKHRDPLRVNADCSFPVASNSSCNEQIKWHGAEFPYTVSVGFDPSLLVRQVPKWRHRDHRVAGITQVPDPDVPIPADADCLCAI